MAELSLEEEVLVLRTRYRERDLVRQVPGARWDQAAGHWRAPLSWGVLWAVAGLFRPDLQVGADVRAWVDARWPEQAALHALRVAATPPEPGPLAGDPTWERLSPLQRVGALFLARARGALIADEMGSGKTVQAVQALRLADPPVLPLLVIAPNSMKYTWRAELERWWPELPPDRVVVADGGAAARRRTLAAVAAGEADVLVINWEAIWRHSRLAPYGSQALTEEERTPKELNAIPWAAVIADEAHRAMSTKTKQTRALWAIGAGSAVRYRLALTGTPLEKAPDQLWPQLRFIAPADWPSRVKFIDRYCAQAFSPFGLEVIGLKPETQEEFWRVAGARLIRRPKEAILPGLPPKRRQVRLLDMPARQAAAYRQLERSYLATLESGADLVALDPLSQATYLSMLASATGADVTVATDPSGRPTTSLTLGEPSCKIDALLELVEEAGDVPLAAFAESRQLLELADARLRQAGIPAALFTGGQTPREREAALVAFRAGQVRVLLLTYGAGAEGITLTTGNVAVFLQRSWSAIKNRQAEDRVHRPGAEVHPEVLLIDLLARDTIDERRLDLLGEKLERLAETLRDRETLRQLLGGSPRPREA